jgi:hypothetical protein
LPPLLKVESRARHDVQTRLENATEKCSNAYAKGKRSFEIRFIRQKRALHANDAPKGPQHISPGRCPRR